MFKRYGLFGLFVIIFAEFAMFFRIEPFYHWFVFTIWFGYILLIDAAVFMLKKESLLSTHPKRFVMLFVLSVVFWSIFEFYNIFLEGWHYVDVAEPQWLHYSLAFSTILPAIMETADLIKQFHFFDKLRIKLKVKISKNLLVLLTVLGVLFLVLPLIFPSEYMWILVWTGFIILLEPINFVILHNDKSLLMQLKKRKFNTILSVFTGGYICGVLWEFWNYWAHAKWHYTIPILEEIKLFELPVLGYAAYGFFALELYVMYQFARALLKKELHVKV